MYVLLEVSYIYNIQKVQICLSKSTQIIFGHGREIFTDLWYSSNYRNVIREFSSLYENINNIITRHRRWKSKIVSDNCSLFIISYVPHRIP